MAWQRRASAAAVTASVLLAGACATSSAADRRAEAARRAVSQIKQQLHGLPHVTTVEAVYGDDGGVAPGSLTVTVLVRPGSYPRLQVMVDRVEQVVWRSPLQPLTSMQVVVQDTSYRHEARVYVLDRDPTWRRLERQYGQRPPDRS